MTAKRLNRGEGRGEDRGASAAIARLLRAAEVGADSDCLGR